jgi:hypothetical protein
MSMPHVFASLARRTGRPLLSAVIVGGLMIATPSAQQPSASSQKPAAPAASAGRVFEMRTYYCVPGRLDALNKRFREHTNRLFVKHGMELVGYWTPVDKPDVLVYILAYPNREAATKAWAGFRADAEWNAARTASESDGKIVDRVESVFMNPTDYSPIK